MAKKPFTPIPPMAELPPAEEINVKEILDKYLAGEIDLICVLGPTASGKTRYAVHLARQINSLLAQISFGEVVQVTESLEDRATRGTEAGGPQAKRSGGVSEANVQDSSSDLQTSDASSRINVTDNSELGLPRAVIRISCSKGTYVRAFARDLGEALGSGAHLDSLQRSRSGLFRIENALTVDQTINLLTAWQANQ